MVIERAEIESIGDFLAMATPLGQVPVLGHQVGDSTLKGKIDM